STGLLAGGGTRPGRVHKTLQGRHIDGDGDMWPHPRTGLDRAGIQVGPAQLHQRISTTLGRSAIVLSPGNADDACEHLLDQLPLFVAQPAPDVGAVQHLGEEQLTLSTLLTPPPVSRLRICAHRPRLDHTGEDIHIHLRCLCNQEPLTHLLPTTAPAARGSSCTQPAPVHARHQAARPAAPRRSAAAGPAGREPAVGWRWRCADADGCAPATTERTSDTRSRPGLARLDTSRALVLQGFHPASHPLHAGSHRSSLLMTEAGERRLRECRQLGTDLSEPFAQLFSRRRDICIGDQRHPRSPPFRPASTSTHQQALNCCSMPAYSLCDTTDTLFGSDPPPTPPTGELLTAPRRTPHRRQLDSSQSPPAPAHRTPTREGAVDNV